MERQQLKNIYDQLGSLAFRFKGKLMCVIYAAETDEYSLQLVLKERTMG